jgi:hypothetical protein
MALPTLGLSTAVRHYNERSVPGLGGLWFGMPIAWSLLGIWLAEGRKKRPLESANAVEAAVMVQALKQDRKRSRGSRNLANVGNPTYEELCKRGSYVTQPFRMSTVEPLLRLGFVQGAGQRFNLYQLTKEAEQFLESFGKEMKYLGRWADGEALHSLPDLLPDEPLPDAAAKLLKRQIRHCGKHSDINRRCALLDLPKRELTLSPLLRSARPARLEPDHWCDLRSGIALVQLREAALAVLADIEERLGSDRTSALTIDQSIDAAAGRLAGLSDAAKAMLAEKDSSPSQLGYALARDCLRPDTERVAELARRDGVVIRLISNNRIALGPAGGERQAPSTEEDHDVSPDAEALVPELPRIANLYSLADDLKNSESRA